MTDAVLEQLRPVAQRGDWVLIGGSPSMAHAIVARLHEASRAHSRTLVLDGVALHTPTPVLTAAVQRVVDEIESRQSIARVSHLLDARAPHGRVRLGIAASADALERGAAEAIVITERYGAREPLLAEALLRQAYSSKAQLTIIGGEAAARLDRLGGGILTHLRYVPPITQSVARRA